MSDRGEEKHSIYNNEVIDADNPQTPSEVRYQGQGQSSLEGLDTGMREEYRRLS